MGVAVKRTFAMGVVALAFSVYLAGQAIAGASLVSSSPEAGAAITEQVQQIDLTFSEDIDIARSVISVAGPRGGVRTTLGQYPKQKSIVLVSLWSALGLGKYTVNWHVRSAGKGTSHGTFSFTVK
jgi:methionine-rich copper-binding protein CopC